MLAVDGGRPVRTAPFPTWPVLRAEETEAAADVLSSGRLSLRTNNAVQDFESDLAENQGVAHAISCSSGTAALHLVLAAMGVGPGDEVIVPAYTFIGSASPVLALGGEPVFADIDTDTYCIAPSSVEGLLNSRTRAVIAVHLNGYPADMAALLRIGAERGIAIIEDAAQAQGARYGGKPVGGLGDFGVLSFWEDKIMTTAGEGGAVLTNDDGFAATLRSLREHGETPKEQSGHSVHTRLGMNYRMTAVQAAVGRVQLRRLGDYVAQRSSNAHELDRGLAGCSLFVLPIAYERAAPAFWKYPVRLQSGMLDATVDDFVRAVRAEGVPIARRYPTPLHRQPVFVHHTVGVSCPASDLCGSSSVAVPVHPGLTPDDIADCVDALLKVAEHMRRTIR